MEADRTGLVHLWLHFAGECYKYRISVERSLADNKRREGFFAGLICTGGKCTAALNLNPESQADAETCGNQKLGPSLGPPVDRSVFWQAQGLLSSCNPEEIQKETGIGSVLFKPTISLLGNGELLFLEATFCELSYSFPSHAGTDCLLDPRAEAIYIFDLLISQKPPQIRNTTNHVCCHEGREVWSKVWVLCLTSAEILVQNRPSLKNPRVSKLQSTG